MPNHILLSFRLAGMLLLVSPFITLSAQVSWSEEEVVLHTGTGDLSGTICLPESTFHPPLLLIIAGSGPTDRNCNSQAGVYSNAYLMLAHELANSGIASLRYDKRGVYKSLAASPPEKDLRFTTYSDDAAAWIGWIKEQERFGKVIIAGHSEGSLLGILAAENTDVDAFISLAGAGENINRILKKQLSDLPENVYTEACSAIDSLSAGEIVKKVNPMLLGLLRPSVQPYMISWMHYDPAVELAKLDIPVLIIQGTSDIQVDTTNALLLHSACPASELHIIQGMNHILKEAPADPVANRATYRNPELPLHPELVPVIITFIYNCH